MLALAALGLFGATVAGSFEQAAFARMEVAAGIAPPIPNSDSEPALTGELTPGYGMRLRSERSSFALKLLPRVYYRYPAFGDIDRPLVLLRGAALASRRMTEVLTWTAAVDGAYGELDYASTRLAFPQPVARNLSDPVVEVREVNGRSALEWRITETYRMDFALFASYTHLIGDTLLRLPKSTALGVDLVERWQLDAVSSLSFPIELRYFKVTNDLDTLSLATRAAYERRLSPRDTLLLDAGLTGWKEEGFSVRVLPRVMVNLSSVLLERAGVRLTNGLSGGVDVIFDPVLGELRPMALLTWTQQLELGTRWNITVLAQGYTSVDPDPLGDTPEERALAVQGESGFGGGLVAGYRFGEPWRFDFGVRGQTRASHWNAENFRLIDEQIWVFTGLTMLFGFGTHETPDWMR